MLTQKSLLQNPLRFELTLVDLIELTLVDIIDLTLVDLIELTLVHRPRSAY